MNAAARKTTLRMLSNGIYIITARAGESYGGATVSWLSQASFKPPLLMAALRRDSNVFRCMQESNTAAIHIVASDQQEIAQRFFTPTRVEDSRMNGQPIISGKTTAPILSNSPAYVECRVRRILDDVGDHAVVILEVIEAECKFRARPLTMAESPWEYGG